MVMHVALGGIAETTIHAEPDGITLAVFHRPLQAWSVTEKPVTMALCPSCKTHVTSPILAGIERSCWETLILGVLIAPLIGEALHDPSFAPLRSKYWHAASKCFRILRSIYSGGVRIQVPLVVEYARQAIRIAAMVFSEWKRSAKLVERYECGGKRAKLMTVDTLAGYAGIDGADIEPRVVVDSHVLVMRVGGMVSRFKPAEHPVRVAAPRVEYALLVGNETVETGPAARISLLASKDVEVSGCGVKVSVSNGELKLRMEGLVYTLDFVAEIPSPKELAEKPLSKRIESLILDALISPLQSCTSTTFLQHGVLAEAAAKGYALFEVVKGPIGYWRIAKADKLIATIPTMYNIFSTLIAPGSPYALAAQGICADSPEEQASLLAALHVVFSHCSRATIIAKKGSKTVVKRFDVPRVAVER
ncbi:hypothetical protein Pyrfu_1562 [Pyrolobus fumarii 1A]|uniref:Uncharacterized protein n=1 Tax=Pyrolobus fumarii (strain DSM 11204 / 1A) TaxID=694429 RepID=G0EC49_PYRF1|nr:hypothetical protein [Pyrolobus fumarii]AEM39419.1 hypothetical protein Pyrfu_1562 [Pyrolobus fumarii 1A]